MIRSQISKSSSSCNRLIVSGVIASTPPGGTKHEETVRLPCEAAIAHVTQIDVKIFAMMLID
jgi:hypothetical protein